MSGGFISTMQSSLKGNRRMLRSVQRRNNRSKTPYASPDKGQNNQSKTKKKPSRIAFLKESRSERQKRAVFVFILVMIATAVIISISIFS